MGYKYQSEERHLALLDRFLLSNSAIKAPGFNREMAMDFVGRKGNESDAYRSNRLCILRQFCLFLALEEPSVFIPPKRFLKINRKNFSPRILTRAEGRSFVESCQSFPPVHCSPIRGIVLGTALLVSFLTGMRAGEVIRLKVQDVDLNSGVLHVRDTKFGKSRFVPVASDLLTRLRLCQNAITKRFGPLQPDQSFFRHSSGKSYSISALREAFHQILTRADIVWQGEGKKMRLHDLRHNAAVLRMLLWYEEGADMEAKLPLLATYLGHTSLAGTQCYLHLTQELLAVANSRYQAGFGDIISDGVTL
ncbi:MAG: tyrosine-type recombinase/integrase [Candidatus Ozemobacteraceae bacterium]